MHDVLVAAAAELTVRIERLDCAHARRMELVLRHDLLRLQVYDARFACHTTHHNLLALVQELERGYLVSLKVQQLEHCAVVRVP